MRLVVTADLHFNHRRSRPLAEELIGRMNAEGGDALLLVGDTSTLAGDDFERCLSMFTAFEGKPRLLVPGNHEFWTHGDDSYRLYVEELPKRAAAAGFRCLDFEPFVAGPLAIVGTVGWYDYSFAQASLGIPRRFYERKVSPGAAARLEEFADLMTHTDDVPPHAMEVVARWNDGRYVKLHRSDEAFLSELLDRLSAQLRSLPPRVTQVIAAVHHLPFRELLPPPHTAQWDFAKAYLGSDRIGQLLLSDPRITHAFCGHSHMKIEAKVGNVEAINIGSGYHSKTYRTIDLPD